MELKRIYNGITQIIGHITSKDFSRFIFIKKCNHFFFLELVHANSQKIKFLIKKINFFSKKCQKDFFFASLDTIFVQESYVCRLYASLFLIYKL